MGELTVIGYSGADLGADALAVLASATLVVGGARHLAAVPVPEGARTIQIGALEPALDALGRHDGNAVVLASGDPGFFGIVRKLRAGGLEVARVIPAVSSIAAAFAAVRLDWDDASVVSAHGGGIPGSTRSLRRAVNACLAHPKVAVLTGPRATPRDLAKALLAAGLDKRDRVVWIAERLGTDQERVSSYDLVEAAKVRGEEPNVALFLAPIPVRESSGWLAGARAGGITANDRSLVPLPDDEFEHRDGQITKMETRALAVSLLGPKFGRLIWDLGAGSGSVGVECARRGAAVLAVEQDAESCERIRRNAARHGGTGLYICKGDAADHAARMPDPDAVFIGGGGMDVLRTVLDRRAPRLVATYASLERAGSVLPLLAGHGYRAEGILQQASRIAPLPDGTHRLAAQNPVFIVWGELL